MICFVGFALFAFLAIFSAKYRSYTLEALECIKSRASAKPCESRFDEKYRAWCVEKAMRIDTRLAKAVNNHFELLNWLVFVLMALMFVFTLEGVYNILVYGSCDPVNGCSIEDGLRWLRG